ncbi:permease component of ABC-type sugar transporter [Sphaerochaeta pleomorpha str. Grapes]|uniref:Permease component of ABC-type sugar transporter n=1 Tax=Sphaerochaeta pleomorpha (strain ATCC BAA-1885 / DSM 22778 / Grapes) TaxID=158190 RepID=G8QUZ5_SPHPG|nr:sugar ABC transporter permease [Sphaerochaeta pleomorpha]AEV28171.1 permease component of ABC-type sugar transporter [Sphaerochaeta pleomorpha str. Grapes]
MQSKHKIGKKQSSLHWFLYLIPALLFYCIFMAFPLLDSLRLSLYTGTSGQARTFIGFANFRKLFLDATISERYWGAFANTWYFFCIHLIFQNCLGILFAVILTNQTMKGRQVYQTILFIPTTFAVLVTGYLWKLMLNPVWSGDFLEKIGLPFLKQPWLGNSSTALTCVAFVSCWQWMGIPTMMFVAALRNISEDCLEAAQIEGANASQVFWRIKLPLIKPVVGMIAVLTFVNNFNAFDVVFAMENVNGAPGYSTDLIGTLFYRYGIAGQHPIGIPDPGLGAAIATITFFVLLLGVVPTLQKTQGGAL